MSIVAVRCETINGAHQNQGLPNMRPVQEACEDLLGRESQLSSQCERSRTRPQKARSLKTRLPTTTFQPNVDFRRIDGNIESPM